MQSRLQPWRLFAFIGIVTLFGLYVCDDADEVADFEKQFAAEAAKTGAWNAYTTNLLAQRAPDDNLSSCGAKAFAIASAGTTEGSGCETIKVRIGADSSGCVAQCDDAVRRIEAGATYRRDGRGPAALLRLPVDPLFGGARIEGLLSAAGIALLPDGAVVAKTRAVPS